MAEAIINIMVMDQQARSKLTALQYEKFPYALAKTLIEVARGSVHKVQAKTKQEFKLHGTFIPKGVTSEPRSFGKIKKEIRSVHTGSTVVFTKSGIAGFMPIHEEGGTRGASTFPSKNVSGGKDKGKSLALPGTKAAFNINSVSWKTGSGKVAKRWHPRTLLQQYSGTYRGGSAPSSTGGSKKKPFVVRGVGSGTPMLVRRVTKARKPLQVLYVFAKSASYPGIWGFETTVRKYVDGHFMTRLRRNIMISTR